MHAGSYRIGIRSALASPDNAASLINHTNRGGLLRNIKTNIVRKLPWGPPDGNLPPEAYHPGDYAMFRPAHLTWRAQRWSRVVAGQRRVSGGLPLTIASTAAHSAPLGRRRGIGCYRPNPQPQGRSINEQRDSGLGIDLGKNSCSLAGLDARGAVVRRRRMRPENVAIFTAGLPACVIAMEACCGAHHLARLLTAQGHEVRLMSPEYVRPYVKAQKNDDRDAEAIAEAATRPTMRFVSPKTEEQLDMQTLHRARDRLIGERTALINQLRAIQLERGTTVPQGRTKLERYLVETYEGDQIDVLPALTPRMRVLIADMRAEWRELDRRIAAFEEEFVARTREDEAARRLITIPGIGVMNATALIAAVGKAWLRFCCLARPGTAADHDWGTAETDRDQQTREYIPAQAVDPRCPFGSAKLIDQHHAAWRLATRTHHSNPQECRSCRTGQQTRPGCLGNLAAWRNI